MNLYCLLLNLSVRQEAHLYLVRERPKFSSTGYRLDASNKIGGPILSRNVITFLNKQIGPSLVNVGDRLVRSQTGFSSVIVRREPNAKPPHHLKGYHI